MKISFGNPIPSEVLMVTDREGDIWDAYPSIPGGWQRASGGDSNLMKLPHLWPVEDGRPSPEYVQARRDRVAASVKREFDGPRVSNLLIEEARKRTTFETKDSGERLEYASGMRRDVETGKPRFDLLMPHGVPYDAQMLTRWAALMGRGAEKYGERNWEKAAGQEELARFTSSALRHLQQWAAGETDEDHAAAVMFNLLAAETVTYRLNRRPSIPREMLQ